MTGPRYSFPLDPGTYTQGRIDEGVDFGTRPGSAIRAMGAAVVDFVGRYSGFGEYLAYHLTGGPAAGEEIYVAEFATPTVRVGQRVQAGQAVAIAAGGLETGFAQRGGTFLPEANPSYSEGDITPAGRRFSSFLRVGRTDTSSFVGIVVAGTGLSPAVVQAWVRAEGGPPDNPLNIGPGRHYGTAARAAAATVALLHTPPYVGIISSATKSDTEQIAAIAASPWDAGHYGGDGRNLLAAYNSGGGSSPAPGRARPGGAGDGSNFDELLGDAAGWAENPGAALSSLLGAIPGIGALEAIAKILGFLFNAHSLLRAVEFLVGMGLIALGLVTLLVNFSHAEEALQVLPAGRALKLASLARSGQREGRRQARRREQGQVTQQARERGRRRERTRQADRELAREGRRTQSDEIPF